jgi:energy-coupling factor transporter ATP-binding protein EcfA2
VAEIRGQQGSAEIREGQANAEMLGGQAFPAIEISKVEAGTNTILVLGRYGSGKSTFLNTLAGVYWTYIDGTFERTQQKTAESKVEMFKTSRSATGCTLAAVSNKCSTIDGREATFIDTIGYDDNVSGDVVYADTSLTEVISQQEAISAVVIVVNSKDPRLSHGFLESVLCIPKSFKKRIQDNVVLVFTNWNEDDEDEHGDEPDRGYTEQIKIIRAAMDFKADDDPIPAFWMDNRPFKSCTSNARRTIDNLLALLDTVDTMPQLSCNEFKEMRALSQFERTVRKAMYKYFQPSTSYKHSDPSKKDMRSPSGFEKFLFKCAERQNIRKMTLNGGFTEQDWCEKLKISLQQEINSGLPKEMEEICAQVDLDLAKNLPYYTFRKFQNFDSLGGTVAKGAVGGVVAAIIATSPFSLGISLAMLPMLPAVAYLHTKSWSRNDAKEKIVYNISENYGNEIRQKYADQFTSHIDDLAQKIEDILKAVHDDEVPEATPIQPPATNPDYEPYGIPQSWDSPQSWS